ncbi:MAG: hypothetical protein AAFP97_12190 [Pseudomonadota bacterium]
MIRTTKLFLVTATYVALGSSASVEAQTAKEPHDTHICAFNGLTYAELGASYQDASPEAQAVISWITQQAGLRNDFDLHGATFERSPIAFAAIRHGHRQIVYDVDKFSAKNGELAWEDIAILAHEIAHHINGDTALHKADSHAKELTADFYAGMIVRRLGGTRENALAVTKMLSEEGSETHPPRKDRENAFGSGWDHADRLVRNGQ